MRAKEYKYNGQKKTLKEWSEETGILSHVISERLRRGDSIEKALTTPAKHRISRKKESATCPYPDCDNCPYPDDCHWDGK